MRLPLKTSTDNSWQHGDLGIAVVIAAYNAERTIRRAIGSALAQPQVQEVVVVDDRSSDNTRLAAIRADDGSGRLKVKVMERNAGPSVARNVAIAASTAPLIAILDSDDFFLDGRFEQLVTGSDWDIVADDIVFVEEGAAATLATGALPMRGKPIMLDLRTFVLSNISRRGQRRREFGFLKPVLSRAFLDRHHLQYDESLRFGEDYDLYVRALLAGGSFLVRPSCGYAAVVRANSLASEHATADLRRLADVDKALLERVDLSPGSRQALLSHERHVRRKYRYRRFLDDRRERGRLRAILAIGRQPVTWASVMDGFFSDKFYATVKSHGAPQQSGTHRLLGSDATV